jgi:hypothetical protein
MEMDMRIATKKAAQPLAAGSGRGGSSHAPSCAHWVWKQRIAVTRFLFAFHLRRMLRRVCHLLAPALCTRKGNSRQPPLPTRRRPARTHAEPC